MKALPKPALDPDPQGARRPQHLDEVIESTALFSVEGVFCHQWGHGEPRWLAIHGWAGDHRTFARLAPKVVAGADGSFVALDAPGHGRSSAPADPSHVDLEQVAERMAGAYAEMTRAHPSARPVLVGTCSGAILAMYVYRTLRLRGVHPAGLVLCEPFARVPRYLRQFTWPLLGPVLYWLTFRNPIGRWIVDRAMTNGATPEPAATVTASFDTIRTRMAVGYLRAFDAIAGPDQFRDIEAPVELIWGTESFSDMPEHVEAWKSVWPEATTESVAGAGHLICEQAPQAAARRIRAATPGSAETR